MHAGVQRSGFDAPQAPGCLLRPRPPALLALAWQGPPR